MNKVEELTALLEEARTKTREVVDAMDFKGVPNLQMNYEFVGWYLDLILHYVRGKEVK